MWPYLKWFCRNVETVSLALNSAVNNSKYGKQLPSKHYKLLGKIPRGIARASQDLKWSRGICTYLEHFSVPILVTRHEHKHNCSDPHFSGEGGTVYATGFFFVQSIFGRPRYSLQRIVSGIIKKAVQSRIRNQKEFSDFLCLQGVIEV